MSETPAADAADEFTEELDNDIWADAPSGPSLITKMLAEVAGTFILVLLGVGTALLFSNGSNGTQTIGIAFGTSVVIAAFAFGAVSGAHQNPAVTVGLWLAGRFPGRDVVPYILAQVIGALFAGAALYLFVQSHPSVDDSKEIFDGVATGFGDHSPAGFGLVTGLFVEALATGLLVLAVLAATSKLRNALAAPFVIGATLSAAVVFAIPFTNGAVNPARATATAPFASSWALGELWLFWVAPIIGAAIVGLLYRAFSAPDEVEVVESVEVVEV